MDRIDYTYAALSAMRLSCLKMEDISQSERRTGQSRTRPQRFPSMYGFEDLMPVCETDVDERPSGCLSIEDVKGCIDISEGRTLKAQ